MADILTKEQYMALHYPRWIYKKGEDPMIVKDVYTHAKYFKEGWSGPPKFYSEIGELEQLIKDTEDRLVQMKEELAVMKGEGREVPEGEEVAEEEEPKDEVPPAKTGKNKK